MPESVGLVLSLPLALAEARLLKDALGHADGVEVGVCVKEAEEEKELKGEEDCVCVGETESDGLAEALALELTHAVGLEESEVEGEVEDEGVCVVLWVDVSEADTLRDPLAVLLRVTVGEDETHALPEGVLVGLCEAVREAEELEEPQGEEVEENELLPHAEVLALWQADTLGEVEKEEV